jgi:hypothetical protein
MGFGTGPLRIGASLEHRAEKRETVFGKNDAATTAWSKLCDSDIA